MAGKPTILITDDEPGPREALRFILGDYYKLLFAEDGFQAVEQAKAQVPDLILMDIKMPRFDGWEAIGRIRSHGYRGPIVVITGYAHLSDRQKGEELGVTAHVSKPFDSFSLRELISELLKKTTRKSED